MDLNESLVEKCLEAINISEINTQRTTEFTLILPQKELHIPEEYYQVFKGKNGFLPDLSIIDLIFNLGPESILYLHKLTKNNDYLNKK